MSLEKFLGKSHYTVKASVGHVRDLPKSTLGVDIENNFEPRYINIRGKGDVIKELKKEAKKSKRVYLATDPDREGEAISWHLAYILGIDERDECRIEFNEITKDAIKKAIKNPRSIDLKLVDAQQARRVLDRLLGYQISPILWAKVRKGLSAGRVQSVTTKLICDREKEIEAFIPDEYWTIDVEAKTSKDEDISLKFYGRSKDKMELPNEEIVNSILDDIKALLPEEVNQAIWINRERQRGITEAKAEAEQIIAQANQEAQIKAKEGEQFEENLKQQFDDIVESNEVVERAKERASEIINRAEAYAIEIREGSLEYAEDVISSVEHNLIEILEIVKRNKRELREE